MSEPFILGINEFYQDPTGHTIALYQQFVAQSGG
jgi:hypothetical protein